MNRKGQVAGIGMIIGVFMAVIVGISLFNGGITSNVAGTTNTRDYNTSTGDGALASAEGSVFDLEGKLVTSFIAVNATNGVDVGAGNYTITNNVLNADNELTAQINTSGGDTGLIGNSWNVSYTYEPVGYITSSGGRSLANLITIFAALAIAVVALIPIFRNSVLKN